MSHPLTRLTPNLWVAQSTLYFTNSGIFLSKGHACLIDPAIFPKEIETIARLVAGQNAVPHMIILTHSHWDHILGPEHFPGIKTVAHAQYMTEVSGKNDAHIRRQIANWEAQHHIEREQPFIISVPDEIFAETTTVTIGDISLYLHHAPGHAADQLVVYHADSATLWASDILSDIEIPFISHNLAAYEQTLTMLSTWDIRVLIPGHGYPTTVSKDIRNRISEDLAYLAALREQVTQAITQGRTVEETVQFCAGMRYRHPKENTGPHRRNIESVYLELGGEADPTKVGWN